MKGLALVLALLPLAASAATITVNTTADNTATADGHCTLREAIANVNAAADTTGGDCAAGTGLGDTIAFSGSWPTKIVLRHGELAIGKDVSIAGPLSIFGSGSRVFEITGGVTHMSDLIIRRGTASVGGGILVDGGASLTMNNCTLRSNRARGFAAQGGAIDKKYGGGTLTLMNCTLRDNMAWGVAPFGGGIFDEGLGAVTLTNCTLLNNRARTYPVDTEGVCLGGGIFNGGGPMTVTNSTLHGNRASAGIGTGDGGGIYNNGGTMVLTNCTLTGNRAHGRNGLGEGGGFAGGIDNVGTMTLTNTIVAGNLATRLGPNCSRRITSNGHNLSNDAACFTSGGSDLVNSDPLLAPLGNYGGPTQTLALCTGPGVPERSCAGKSPAIDAGDDTVIGPPDNLTTDQRSLPRLSGAHVDIGAYEVQQ